MQDTIFRIRLMVLLLLVALTIVVWMLPRMDSIHSREHLLVHFFDVGQGDAIFIQTPSGIEVLIDGGASNGVLRSLSQKMSFFDRKIDMVIGTHPDIDHIGGLVDVLARYDVEAILTTNNKGGSTAATEYKRMVKTEGAEVILARRGQVFSLGDEIFLKVLFPVYDTEKLESNASSIIVQLVYGDTEVLLTGDSPKRIEEFLVMEGVDLQSDVLKVGHHGSRTSTSEMFLEAVSPQYAVISAEADSRYGHPHVEVTDMLFNHRVETYSTAEEGTVTFESDGVKWINIYSTPLRP